MHLLINETNKALRLWRYIFYSASLKILLRNAGSKLGLLWEPLSTLIVSFVLSAVWIKVLGVQIGFSEYFLYVYVGMVVWGGLAGAVSNLCATLVKNAKNITSRNLPIFSYLFEDILISFFPFVLSVPFVLLLIVACGSELSLLNIAVFIAGFLLVLLTSFAFSLSIGLCAFFIGDIRQIITAVMRLSFLVTPVIWKAERLKDSEYLLLLNPFYGYLHIMRSGLLGEDINIIYVYQSLGITGFLLLVGAVMFSNMVPRIQHRALVL